MNLVRGSHEKGTFTDSWFELQGVSVRGSTSSSEALQLLRAGWARTHITNRAAIWRPWAVFCDHHRLDETAATDAHLAAFTLARVRVGIAWQTCANLLWLYRAHVEGDGRLDRGDDQPRSATIAAARLLADLHDDGAFDPATRQAPLLTLGQVRTLVDAAAHTPVGNGFDPELIHARDLLLVLIGYLAGLRPGEWTWIDLEHLEVHRGEVQVFLPETKTGTFQKVTIGPVAQLDAADAVARYLELRGDAPGPLLTDGRGHGLRRVNADAVSHRLRMVAAQAGITRFAPYSLRRSMAAHLQLLGTDSAEIRRRLRHTERSTTYRRYVEPLLAVMGQDEARTRWLDPTPTSASPVPLEQVRAHPARAQHPASIVFAGGSLDELLADLDLPKLRVPAALAETAASSISSGRQMLRRFATWARANEVDATAPRTGDLVRYVRHRLDQVQPQSVIAELEQLQIGLTDATGRSDWPELRGAKMLAKGAYARALDEHTVDAPAQRKHSRPATDADVEAILPLPPASPGNGWAAALLRYHTGGRPLQVLHADEGHVELLVAGRTVRLPAHDGILCPVAAAALLLEEGAADVSGGPATLADVAAAASSFLGQVRARMVLTLQHGSGARPSDLARARTAGVQPQPGGLLVVLSAEKGARPGRRGRPPALWAPRRDDELDPLAAWELWRAWWPLPDGPLVPDLDDDAGFARGQVRRLSNSKVGQLSTGQWRKAGIEGLTSYGMRYGRAGVMHDQGFSDLEIAEALNHDDLEVTRGYIQLYRPFADIDAGRNPLVRPEPSEVAR